MPLSFPPFVLRGSSNSTNVQCLPSRCFYLVVALASIIGCGLSDPSTSDPPRGFLLAKGKPVFRANNPEPWAPDWDEPVDADPQSFKSVFAPKTAKVAFHYACDSKKVFIGVRGEVYELENADPSTFKVLDPIGYFSIDANHVYYIGFQLQDADAGSFQVVGTHYGKDKNSVFFGPQVLVGAEPQSFIVLSEGKSFLASSHHSGVGPLRKFGHHQTHTKLEFSGFWAKDSQFCFYCSKKLEDADSASFRVIDRTTAEDQKWRWSEERGFELRRFELNP